MFQCKGKVSVFLIWRHNLRIIQQTLPFLFSKAIEITNITSIKYVCCLIHIIDLYLYIFKQVSAVIRFFVCFVRSTYDNINVQMSTDDLVGFCLMLQFKLSVSHKKRDNWLTEINTLWNYILLLFLHVPSMRQTDRLLFS